MAHRTDTTTVSMGDVSQEQSEPSQPSSIACTPRNALTRFAPFFASDSSHQTLPDTRKSNGESNGVSNGEGVSDIDAPSTFRHALVPAPLIPPHTPYAHPPPVNVALKKFPSNLHHQLRVLATSSFSDSIKATIEMSANTLTYTARTWQTQPRKSGKPRNTDGDGLYAGTWKGFSLQGLGLYVWNDGKRYFGHWKNNVIDGTGIFVWPVNEAPKTSTKTPRLVYNRFQYEVKHSLSFQDPVENYLLLRIHVHPIKNWDC
eukprot:TRINITY_DN4765_c0_g1_i3.p1 TRINITY_DN4765_c0_g1~~TRINITY_DN4765_c0_g1_i3.p1  ORF type:complete len:266 (+),score=26.24 TRINITY_DN4765_c0_g1_i3:24-800(+)